MANNYKGIFFGLDNKKYQVDIIGNPESNEYVSFELAAQSPFVVSYSASDTPFDPVRTATAQINTRSIPIASIIPAVIALHL